MRFRLRRVLGDAGAAVVEYAVLLALIAIVCVGALAVLGNRTSAKLKDDKVITALGGTTSTTEADDDHPTPTTAAPTTTTTRCRGRFC